MMNGVSISTTVFGPKGKAILPLAEAAGRLAEAGYRQIEVSRKHLISAEDPARLAALGIQVWAVHGSIGGGHLFGDETGRRQSVDGEIARMKQAAAFAPCPYVIHYTSRFHDPRPGLAFRKSVEELARAAEGLRIVLAIETVPHKASNERYPDSREVADFARSFHSRCVQVCLDVNHSNLGEDLAVATQNCRGVIANIHVSDNYGKTEDHLPPGEGTIDLPRIMQAVADAGYAGPLNMEFHTPDYPEHTQLVRARRWAETLLARLRPAFLRSPHGTAG